MSFLTKINKIIDITAKVVLILVAFSIALIPVIYLRGHENIHHQYDSQIFSNHQSRAPEIQSAVSSKISNIYLKESGTIGSQELQQTIDLGNFICYWLKQQGHVVVRKHVETKLKVKGKKGQSQLQIPPTETVQTLFQAPPLSQIKTIISNYIDFEAISLSRKIWVIISFGELQNRYGEQIETISDQNPDYKFIIVSPIPIQHKLLRLQQAATQQTDSKGKNGKEESAVSDQKRKSKQKKIKVKKVKVEEPKEEEKKTNETATAEDL